MYDVGIWSGSERRRNRRVGVGDAVYHDNVACGVDGHVGAEEVASVSGEVVVDGETRLHVERRDSSRLSYRTRNVSICVRIFSVNESFLPGIVWISQMMMCSPVSYTHLTLPTILRV